MTTAIDVQVRGSGIVGKALALALGRIGVTVALQAEPRRADAPEDVRAYALNAASVRLLASLKVWDALAPGDATPVYDMRVRGDDGASALEFSAWQQRVGELAWIVDAAAVERELDSALRFAPHVSVGTALQPAALTAICEGRASAGRAELGVAFDEHPYGQRAIAARLTASAPHAGTALQWFRSPDVLALLPIDKPRGGASYALVWSLPDARARALLDADDAGFVAELMAATGGAAGELALASRRAAWPLSVGQARSWCGPGWVLLGDAAHVIHPLAGQGLNLGLADVAALVDVIAAREPWRRLGDERLLRRYVRQRAAPTWAMQRTTDALWRLFSHDADAFKGLRNQGIGAVNRITPLKRWLTAQALNS
ncbi:FAD-dependent monooxygenase [Piscinibacter koreensis]|uniref:FAD-dependent monooxygenase n=1 Tax=Piscinibacter koreensis TaxID=2742824 RepID=A0A7Y6NPU7_9BURK|nr:FAD-dependent monooxygenase [Schlegelella koreensis]